MSNEFSLPPDARARQRMLDQQKPVSESTEEAERERSGSPAVSVADPPPEQPARTPAPRRG